MERVFRLLFNVRELRLRCDDDGIDRLSKRYTTSLFLFFAMLVTSKTYVGDPIRCWCPAQFTDSHKHYTNNICWVSHTYYIPAHKQREYAKPIHIGYYQWVPFILLSQAVICYLPSVFWGYLHKKSGLDLLELIEASDSFRQRHQGTEQRTRTRAYIVYSVNRYLAKKSTLYSKESRRSRTTSRTDADVEGANVLLNKDTDQSDMQIRVLPSQNTHKEASRSIHSASTMRPPTSLLDPLTACLNRHTGRCYLALTYLLVKLMYAGSAVLQILILDQLLGQGYKLYGIEVLARMMQGKDWTFLERFPRVTMCDFRVRALAGVQHRYVVQCALSINLFNEKIFLVVWCVLATVCLVTLVDFVKWAMYFGPHFVRLKYTSDLIDVAYTCTNEQVRCKAPHSRGELSCFIHECLQTDGLYICHILEDIVGRTTAAEVVRALWEKYNVDANQRIKEITSY